MLGIIPAAGFGTRLYELGKSYPKSILPYKERPLLVWNVEWLRLQGCSKIVIVVNHQKEKIQEVIDTYDLHVDIADVEVKGGGLSKSVKAGLDRLLRGQEDQDALILLGDLLVTNGTVDKGSNAVSTFKVDDWTRWCLIDPETGIFYDKPEDRPPTDQAISGVYYVKSARELSDCIDAQLDAQQMIRGEYQISSALERLGDPVQTFDLDILDFGTLNSYLRNRGLRNSRSFNTVEIEQDVVTKRSENRNKIVSEANWYRSLPHEVAIRTPRILNTNFHGYHGAEYTMERLLHPTLREMYLFVDRSEETWSRVLREVFTTHRTMSRYTSTEDPGSSMRRKNEQRVQNFEEQDYIGSFLRQLNMMMLEYEKGSVLIHGDLCYSNLMWNAQTGRILMLDPRGELYGSRFYDIAKIRHSALYDYDFIDAELYTVDDQDDVRLFNDGTSHLKELYRSIEAEFFSPDEIEYLEMLTASLFLTMIPLHDHNEINQNLFYGKFKHIYSEVSGRTGAFGALV